MKFQRLLPFLLLCLVGAIIAVATLVENGWGTDAAHLWIYGSWWFAALWGLTAATATWWIIRKRMWKRPTLLLMHLSLLIILLGALVTHLTSRSGQLWIHEGEAVRNMWVKVPGKPYAKSESLPFMICLKRFQIEYDADGVTPKDYISQVILKDRETEEQTAIRMNQVGRTQGYRIYQTSYDLEQRASLFTVSYDPWGTGITYLGYALLAATMMWYSRPKRNAFATMQQCRSARRDALAAGCPKNNATSADALAACYPKNNAVTQQRSKLNNRISVWVLAVLATILASYMVVSIAFRPLVPILRSPYLVVHIGTILLAYILLVVSILRRNLLRPAVFLLSTGIFLGAVWANVSWGTYWSWDPKESWALITLLLYCLPLHQQSLPWFQSQKHYRLYSLLCLLSLLMTYFGVSFLGGMHSY